MMAVKIVVNEFALDNDNSRLKSRLIADQFQFAMKGISINPSNHFRNEDVARLKEKLVTLQFCELMDSCQRAHIEWITSGDQSMTFFAKATKVQQNKNSTMRLLDTKGKHVTSLQEMK